MKISIVIVEYNSIDDVAKYLETIQPSSELEVIVSSNSIYSKEVQENLCHLYPQCIWQFNERNGGFAYAMNRGLARATGDVLVISNPDCIIRNGLHDMADFLLQHPGLGAIAPQIVDQDNNIQDSCRPYVTLPRYILRQAKRGISRKKAILERNFDYQAVQTVDWVIGAFIMVTREAYENTNGLCDDYFMYAEDLDWCTRIRRSGLEIAYYPRACVEYEGTRSARSSLKYMKVFLRSHLIYWKRYGFLFIKPKRSKTF